ncbi:hypothetical protein D3C81_1463500 [compost metagenome]
MLLKSPVLFSDLIVVIRIGGIFSYDTLQNRDIPVAFCLSVISIMHNFDINFISRKTRFDLFMNPSGISAGRRKKSRNVDLLEIVAVHCQEFVDPLHLADSRF